MTPCKSVKGKRWGHIKKPERLPLTPVISLTRLASSRLNMSPLAMTGTWTLSLTSLMASKLTGSDFWSLVLPWTVRNETPAFSTCLHKSIVCLWCRKINWSSLTFILRDRLPEVVVNANFYWNGKIGTWNPIPSLQDNIFNYLWLVYKTGAISFLHCPPLRASTIEINTTGYTSRIKRYIQSIFQWNYFTKLLGN